MDVAPPHPASGRGQHCIPLVVHAPGTCTVNDSLDLLAEFMGVKEQVEALTNKAGITFDAQSALWTATFARAVRACSSLARAVFLTSFPAVRPRASTQPGQAAQYCAHQALHRTCWHALCAVPPVQAMDGKISLEQALEERLAIINCSPADIKRFIAAHPPQSRLVPVSCRAQLANSKLKGTRDLVYWLTRSLVYREGVPS
jgi:hypothetical protein